MKRRLWIIPALAVLLAAFLCGAALADGGLNFTVQPTVGELDPVAMVYPVTWQTGFTPVRVEFLRQDPVTGEFDQWSTLDDDQLAMDVTTPFMNHRWGYNWKVRAYWYGNSVGTGRFAESLPFGVGIDDPNLSFTAQPAVGALDPVAMAYPVTWQTGFTPVDVELLREDPDTGEFIRWAWLDDDEVAMDVTIPFMNHRWGYNWKVRAYWYGKSVETGRFAESQPFAVGIDDPNLSFTSQPAVGALDPVAMAYPVTWQTGFTPVDVELLREDPNTGEFIRWAWLDNDEVAMDVTTPFRPGRWGYNWKIRAYWYGKSVETGRFAESQPFAVGIGDPNLSFTVQPRVGELDPVAMVYPVTWQTGFTPVDVELLREDPDTGEYIRWAWLDDDELAMDVTTPFRSARWGYRWKIRAYWFGNSVGTGRFAESLPINLKVYSVTFDANGGTGVMAPVTTVGNGRYTLPACGFTREGYEFDCWQIGTHSYPPGTGITMVGDMTVRAIWRKYCSVTFNANGGTGSAEPVTVLAGTQITLPENPFTSETHNFSYWGVSSLPNVKKYPGGTFTVTQNTTVTAVWVPKVWCTLTFNMNGYGTQIPPITVEKGTIVSEPTRPTSTYRFGYWEVNVGSTQEVWQPFDFSQPVTQSATLRAHWVSNAMRRVRLSYDREAGSVTLTAAGQDGDMIPVSETVHINITENPHFSLNWIYVGTLQTHSRVFDMPNQDTVYVRVTFTRDHEHSTSTLQKYTSYTAPTCEADGCRCCWYCPECDHYYTDGTYDWLPDGPTQDYLVIPALGHAWGVPEYTWAEDLSSVTATAVCTRDAGHILTETVDTTAAVTKEPGGFTRGEHTYTAAFENPEFSEQSLTVDDIAPLGIPVTADFFPDEGFRAYVSADIDRDGNGFLSDAERNLYFMYCNSKGAASLEGIEYFQNLIRVTANYNPDLTAINASCCPQLNMVQAIGSPVASLDIAGCTKLTALMLRDCTLIGVDLSGNTRLTQVDVINCANLNAIDLSHAPNLTTLNTWGSGILYLDIEGNPYLRQALQGTKTVTDEYEEYYVTGVTLRVNHGTEFSGTGCIPLDEAHFPDPVFRAAVAEAFDTNGSGWLNPEEIAAATALSLTGLEGLEDLTGIGYLTELETLRILSVPTLTDLVIPDEMRIRNLELSGTGITVLDLSGMSSLRTLNCADGSLTGLILGDMPVLQSLDCHGNPCLFAVNLLQAPMLEDAVRFGTLSAPGGGYLYETVDASVYADTVAELITSDCVPLDDAHFPDPVFRDAVAAEADRNGSGWLTLIEIDETTELSLHNRYELTDITGTEYLTSLTSLSVSNALLLTGVRFCGHPALRAVSFWNTGVTSLNVQDLALTVVSCDSCPLQELFLGDQPNMRILSCYGTGLSSVDISGCPLLIEAYFGEFIADSLCDSYEALPFCLYVNPGAAVVTGIPEPNFRLPDGLRVLEDEAFADTMVLAVIIPPSVTQIDGDPFADSSVHWIYGLRGSAAETYVLEHPGMTFVPVTETWLNP